MRNIHSSGTNSETRTPTGSPPSNSRSKPGTCSSEIEKITDSSVTNAKFLRGSTVKTSAKKSSLTPAHRKPKSKKTGHSNNTSVRSRPNGMITVNIGTLTGKQIVIDVYPTETIAQLKERIAIEAGISAESQMIVFCGKHLSEDTAVLKTIGIQDESNLQLVLQMAGGVLFLMRSWTPHRTKKSIIRRKSSGLPTL